MLHAAFKARLNAFATSACAATPASVEPETGLAREGRREGSGAGSRLWMSWVPHFPSQGSQRLLWVRLADTISEVAQGAEPRTAKANANPSTERATGNNSTCYESASRNRRS